MDSAAISIERLSPPIASLDLHALAELLCDAVNSGAAVSFLAPLTLNDALDWWRLTFEQSGARSIFLVARERGDIVGTVQLHPCWAPNQPHRADVAKLIVHRRARGNGVGVQLMQRVEEEARRAGLWLLVLDTRRGCEAENLYRKLGWTEAGAIPNFAINADRSGLHETVIFYKELPHDGEVPPP